MPRKTDIGRYTRRAKRIRLRRRKERQVISIINSSSILTEQYPMNAIVNKSHLEQHVGPSHHQKMIKVELTMRDLYTETENECDAHINIFAETKNIEAAQCLPPITFEHIHIKQEFDKEVETATENSHIPSVTIKSVNVKEELEEQFCASEYFLVKPT